MAFNKRTWLGRQGTGLNKFSIGGATPVTIVNQPDSITQVGDALSAGNLNDLEDRIEDAFDETASASDVQNLQQQVDKHTAEIANLNQKAGDYIVSTYKDGSTTPSGKGKWCVVEGVEGVSRVENNLGKATTSGSAITRINDYSVSVSFDSSFTGYPQICDAIQTVNAHKYLIYFKQTSGTNLRTTNSGIFKYYDAPTIEAGKYYLADGDGTSNALQVTPYTAGVGGSGTFTFFVTDLNVYFGTSDLSFLGATDSAKLATIQKDYSHLLLPTEYGTRIVDWTGNGVRAEGVNIWDEEWVLGNYSDSTGEYVNAGNYVISKNPIPILPNYTYYCNTLLRKFYYDADMNYIGNTANLDSAFTTPANAFYMNIRVHQETGAYNHDVQVCDNALSSEIKNTYHPYMESTLSFPSTSLKSAGSVREKYLLAEGEKTNPLAEYTFDGTEGWTSGGDGLFYTTKFASEIKIPDSTAIPCDVMLVGYVPVPRNNIETNNLAISVSATGNMQIRNTAWSSASDVVTALTGKTIRFALATPSANTPATAITNNTLLTEAYGRMATVQTGTVVDGISDLGFITL